MGWREDGGPVTIVLFESHNACMLKNCSFIFYPLSYIYSKIVFKKTPLPHVKKTESVPSILDSK